MKRHVLAVSLLFLAFDALAQAPRSRPEGTMPLDEAPPPPPVVQADPALEPEVTIRTEGDQTVQEYRSGGKVVMLRVTPRHGRPYVLMDHRGDGTMTRHDNPLDQGVRGPQWTLLEF